MPYWKDIKDNKQKRCPRYPIFKNPEWWNKIVSALNNYESGFLPHAGGIHNQNSMFSDIMQFTRQYLDQYDKIATGKDAETKARAKQDMDDGEWVDG